VKNEEEQGEVMSQDKERGQGEQEDNGDYEDASDQMSSGDEVEPKQLGNRSLLHFFCALLTHCPFLKGTSNLDLDSTQDNSTSDNSDWSSFGMIEKEELQCTSFEKEPKSVL
jgi:hypothetical protein